MRSVKLGKLEVVKTEMEINIIGIGELKWTGLGHFRSGEPTIYYSGHEQQRRIGVAFTVKKDVNETVIGYKAVNERLMSVQFRAQSFSITVIQIFAPTEDASNEETAVLWLNSG